MALISIADWIDRFGDDAEPAVVDSDVLARMTISAQQVTAARSWIGNGHSAQFLADARQLVSPGAIVSVERRRGPHGSGRHR